MVLIKAIGAILVCISIIFLLSERANSIEHPKTDPNKPICGSCKKGIK